MLVFSNGTEVATTLPSAGTLALSSGHRAPHGAAPRDRHGATGPGRGAPGASRGEPADRAVLEGRLDPGGACAADVPRRDGPAHPGRGRHPHLERGHRRPGRRLRHRRAGHLRPARRPQGRVLGRPGVHGLGQPHRRGPRLLRDHVLRSRGSRSRRRLRPRDGPARRRLGGRRSSRRRHAHLRFARTPGRERRLPGGSGSDGCEEEMGGLLLGREQRPEVRGDAELRVVERGARVLHRRHAGAPLAPPAAATSARPCCTSSPTW